LHFCFRQVLRNSRKGVSASTHFIGAAVDNFSNFPRKPIVAILSRIETVCTCSLHSMSQSTPAIVPFRFRSLPRFDPAMLSILPSRKLRKDQSLRLASRAKRIIFAPKKSAARGSPPAAIGFEFQPDLLSACKPVLPNVCYKVPPTGWRLRSLGAPAPHREPGLR
jgi:hypothetical protein